MTTEGQGRAADPVGFGIPVVIDGPWAEPRIYPDVAGMLDNPDAAYAKLKEMGKGLFGTGRRIGRLDRRQLRRIGRRRAVRPAWRQARRDPGQPAAAGLGPEPRSRPRHAGLGSDPAPSAPPQSDPPPQQQDSQPMNDVLKQLFNR